MKSSNQSQDDKETFREYFHSEIENQIKSNLNPVLKNNQPVEIACINFAYANGYIIKALKRRGALINEGDIHGIARIET